MLAAVSVRDGWGCGGQKDPAASGHMRPSANEPAQHVEETTETLAD